MKDEKIKVEERRNRLLRFLKKPRTANEAIDIIFKRDWKNGNFMGWRYYVHLNKLLAPLQRDGKISLVGTKVGPSNRTEKIWVAV